MVKVAVAVAEHRAAGLPYLVQLRHPTTGGVFEPVPDVPAAESIRRSRRPERPSVRALLEVAANDVTPLSGTVAGEMDPGVLLALARFGAAPCPGCRAPPSLRTIRLA